MSSQNNLILGRISIVKESLLRGSVLFLLASQTLSTGWATPPSLPLVQDFNAGDVNGFLSDAPGWSSNNTEKSGGYLPTEVPGDQVGYVGNWYSSVPEVEVGFDFSQGNSDRLTFQWSQSVTKSEDSSLPALDGFGWVFKNGATPLFSLRMEPYTGTDLVTVAYDGSGTELASGYPGAPQPNFAQLKRTGGGSTWVYDFRVEADLKNGNWSAWIWRNGGWFMLVDHAALPAGTTQLNRMAAIWTLTDTHQDGAGIYDQGGSNLMYFDNITVTGRQTVELAIQAPTGAVYNGSGYAATVTTTPSNIAVKVKYNNVTNVPVNAGNYTVSAEVVDTNTYYNAPATASFSIAKANLTPVFSGSNNVIYDGSAKSLSASTTPSKPVTITYNGSTNAPSQVGTYTVVATVNDANYQGSASTTLTITAPVTSVLQDFNAGDVNGFLSDAPGWSSNNTEKSGGYLPTEVPGDQVGYVGNWYSSVPEVEVGFDFSQGNSDRLTFQWSQSVTKSEDSSLPALDGFGWVFKNGATPLFSLRMEPYTGTDLVTVAYDGSGTELASGYPGAPQPNFAQLKRTGGGSTWVYDFRVEADLKNGNWSAWIWRNGGWFMLVDHAALPAGTTQLNRMAAIWTLTDTHQDGAGIYDQGGSNLMYFDNITVTGRQTVELAIQAPTGAVYNGSGYAATVTTTPSNIAVKVKYNNVTNVPVNAGNYTVSAEVVDTNTYYNAPATASFSIAKANLTPVFSGSNNVIYDGSAKSLSASTTPSKPVTITYNGSTNAPSQVGTYTVVATVNDANYQGSASTTLTITSATTPLEDYLISFGLQGSNLTTSADPDGDGLNNAAEFAYGTDPTKSTASPVTITESPGVLKMSFLGRTNGVTYVVKTTTDLSTSFAGTNAPTLVSPQPSGLPAGYGKYEASVSTVGVNRKFLKVDATLP